MTKTVSRLGGTYFWFRSNDLILKAGHFSLQVPTLNTDSIELSLDQRRCRISFKKYQVHSDLRKRGAMNYRQLLQAISTLCRGQMNSVAPLAHPHPSRRASSSSTRGMHAGTLDAVIPGRQQTLSYPVEPCTRTVGSITSRRRFHDAGTADRFNPASSPESKRSMAFNLLTTMQ